MRLRTGFLHPEQSCYPVDTGLPEMTKKERQKDHNYTGYIISFQLN